MLVALHIGYAIAGWAPLDEVLGELSGSVVLAGEGLPPSGRPVPWVDVVGTARRRGALGTLVRLPTAGDVRGVHPLPEGYRVPHPLLALVTAEAIVAWIEGTDGTWRMRLADQALPPSESLAEADRDLRAATLTALQEWHEGDFLAGDPASQESIARSMRPWARLSWPSADPQVTVRAETLPRALRLFTATSLAAGEDRGLTSTDMRRRADVMRELNRAARTAVEACCSVQPGR